MAVAAPKRFKTALDKPPHDAIAAALGPGFSVRPVPWKDWRGTRYRHAGANDPAVRMHEPNLPDVSGLKYRILGAGAPPRQMDLLSALHWFLDRGDCSDVLTVEGSLRPIVFWKEIDVPRIDYVGASVLEARAVTESGRLVTGKRDMVIFRIRMSRGTLNRIAAVAAYEQQLYNDGRKGKYMSAAALGVLLEWLERQEKVIAAIHAAHFSGSTP